MAPASTRPEILFERRGAAGIVILNRPQALNAVTFGMVGALTRQLVEWEGDPAVTRVIVTAAGPRAFMGGGVGISIHGSHRVAGDRFAFAMPEVGIGFFPDVGATWFLPRLPGELGAYCALTGERFGIADACAAGLATHRIPSAHFGALLDELAGTV